MSDPLERVMDHLRSIRSRANDAPLSPDYSALRAVIAEYNAVSPETDHVLGVVKPVDANGIPGEWVTTPDSDPNRRLLYIHGGSWTPAAFPDIGRWRVV